MPVYASMPQPPLGPVRKALAPLAAFIGELIALNVLHGRSLEIASAVLAALALLGVFFSPPNVASPPEPDRPNSRPDFPDTFVGEAPVAAPYGHDPAPVTTDPPVQRRTPRSR